MAEQFKAGDHVRFKGGAYPSLHPWKWYPFGKLRPGDIICVQSVSRERLYYRCLYGRDIVLAKDVELAAPPAPSRPLPIARIIFCSTTFACGLTFGGDYLTHERITKMQSAIADIIQGGPVRTAIEHSLSAGCYLALAWMGLLLLRGVGKDMGKLGDRRRRILDEGNRRRIEEDNRTTADTRERNRIFKEEKDQKRARKAEKKARKLRQMAELVGRMQPSRLEERLDGRGQQILSSNQPLGQGKQISVGDTVEFLGTVQNNAMIQDGATRRDVRKGDRVIVSSMDDYGNRFYYTSGGDKWWGYLEDVRRV